MRTNELTPGCYVSPAVNEVELIPEGILCGSVDGDTDSYGEGGTTDI